MRKGVFSISLSLRLSAPSPPLLPQHPPPPSLGITSPTNDRRANAPPQGSIGLFDGKDDEIFDRNSVKVLTA